MQGITIGGSQHSAAASGQQDVGLCRQFIDDFLLPVAKCLFTVLGEVVLDRHADSPFDFSIAVGKPQSKLARQMTPDGGLATAG